LVVFSIAEQQQQQAKRQRLGQQWQGLVHRQKAWKRGKLVYMTSYGLTEEVTCQADQMLTLLVLICDLQWIQKQRCGCHGCHHHCHQA